jgi:hypothetical protein
VKQPSPAWHKNTLTNNSTLHGPIFYLWGTMKKSLGIGLAILAVAASGYGLWQYFGNGGSTFSVRHIAVREDGEERWSILDLESGKIIVDREWKEEPEHVSEGIITLKNKEGEYELFTIDEKPKRIGKTFAAAGMCLEGLIPVAETDKPVSYIDAKGNTIFTLKEADGKNVTEAGHFREGLARFRNADGKYGYVDRQGKVAVKAQFDEAGDFREGHALVSILKKIGNPGDSLYREIETVGLINRNGEFTISPKEADSSASVPTQTPVNGLVMYTRQQEDKNTVGFMDVKGNIVIKADKSYRRATSFMGKYAAYSNGDEWGIMDRKGESVIRPKYDMCFFYDDLLYIREKNQWGCITVEGKELIEPEFREILPFFNKHTVARDGKDFILINREGKEVGENSFKVAHYNRLMASWMTGNFPTVKSDLLDADALLSRILKELKTPDLKALNGKSAHEIAALFEKENDDISAYSYSLSKHIFEIDDVSVSLVCRFNESLKTYDVAASNGMIEAESSAINPLAKVNRVELEIDLYQRLQPKDDKILTAMKKIMTGMGYTESAAAASPGLIWYNDSLGAITIDGNTLTLYLSFSDALELEAPGVTTDYDSEAMPFIEDLSGDRGEAVEAPAVEGHSDHRFGK